MRKLILLFAMFILLTTPMAQAAKVPSGPGYIAHIDQAVAAGELSFEQGLLYKFQYGFDQPKLPAEYRPDTFVPLKNGSQIIYEFESRRAELSTVTQDIIDGYLAPSAVNKATYDSPSGRFRLTYATTGSNAVSTIDTSPPNGIPDYVEKMALYMDESWQVEIIDNGFTAPPTTPYPISFEAMGYYGYTSSTGGTSTRIVLHNTFLGFPSNNDPEGNQWGAAKVTCAHEFKHASQMAQSGWSEGGWVELDATWCEELVYDYVDDYYNYLLGSSPIRQPATSLDSGGSGSYEDCVWEIWMSETYTNQIITDLWNWRRTHTGEGMMTSYEQMLVNYGSTLAESWADFTAWNYAVGTRSITGLGYDEASAYPLGTPVLTTSTYPSNHSGTVAHLAANFIRTYNFGGEVGTVNVTFDGADNASMTLTAVIEKTDGTGVIERVPLDAANDATVSLSIPMEDIAEVGLVVANNHKSADGAGYSITVEKGQYTAQPILVLDTQIVTKTMEIDATDTESILLSNTGEAGSSLDFVTTIQPFKPATTAAVKSIAGSTLTADVSEYIPGQTVDIVFTVSNGSTDDEWLTDVNVAFPTGVTPNSATSFVGGTHGNMTASAPGANVAWHGDTGSPNYYGVIVGGESATATVNVTFDAGLSGDQSLSFTVTGDQWGGTPHSVTGAIVLVTSQPAVTVNSPNGGETQALGEDLGITWSANMISDVKIELSRNNGVAWETLTASTPNDGSFDWLAAGAASAACRVRISSLDDLYSDTSDAVFRLFEPVTWLAVTPKAGSIAQGTDLSMNLLFDTTGLAVDDYTAYLIIDHNGDPAQDSVRISLTTEAPASAVGEMPVAFHLADNYPNPFNPRTTIRFAVVTTGLVTVDVLDLRGRLVKTLKQGTMAAGEHSLAWDGTNEQGKPVAAGIYLARLRADGRSATSKMVLAK